MGAADDTRIDVRAPDVVSAFRTCCHGSVEIQINDPSEAEAVTVCCNHGTSANCPAQPCPGIVAAVPYSEEAHRANRAAFLRGFRDLVATYERATGDVLAFAEYVAQEMDDSDAE